MSAQPYDTLCRAANLIRWNQRLLCGIKPENGFELDQDELAGLYWTFEEILEDIAEVLKVMEEKATA